MVETNASKTFNLGSIPSTCALKKINYEYEKEKRDLA